MPNIDWNNNCLCGHNYPSCLCELILDTFGDIGLTQLVDFPTRGRNILDIFATNRPSLVEKCIPIPGIGDHEAVYFESSIQARYTRPAQRKVFLWSKTDFSTLSDIITHSCAVFAESFYKYTYSRIVESI